MIKKIKSSIGLKTFLCMTALMVTGCILIYGCVLYFLPRNYQTELEGQFTSGFQDLVSKLEHTGIEENSQEIGKFSIKNNASLSISDDNDNKVFAFNSSAAEDESKTLSHVRSFTATSAFRFGDKNYTLTATAAFVAVAQSYEVLLNLIPFIAIVILVISTLGALLCSRSFSKPLIDICGVSKRMAHLDMTWKCSTKRNDEIGVLAVNLNEMAERLNAALVSLQEANEQLQQDIENERRQEKQRIDFFTAVSHELKTPITIIKGELEGMIYQVGDYKDRDVYLRHSFKTAETMEKLVKEILSAAKMGTDDFELNKTNVDISSLVEKRCREVQGLAEDKSITIALNVQPGVHFQGDEILLKKAISNVITNAVFHSPQGANIFVSLQGKVLTVENTGVHLTEQDQKQLFTPFYRVDKSRNSGTGGSGLGLYIVKNVLDRHNLSYLIANTEQGVCFQIAF